MNNKSEKIEELELQFIELTNQHVYLLQTQKQISIIQGDIAKQLLLQTEHVEELLKSLGLKRDLSEYSYRIFDGPTN